MRNALFVGTLAAALLSAAGCATGTETPPAAPEAGTGSASGSEMTAAAAFTLPAGLTGVEMQVPADNPLTGGKIKLGEQLFFDTRLSVNSDMSCETCHIPEKGWTDGRDFAPKFNDTVNTRHSPTLYGVAFYPELYWDGRSRGLEPQILAAWKGNMGADPAAIAARLDGIPGYQEAFAAEMGGPPTGERIVQALASFVRTIQAGDTEWDRHPQDEASLAGSEIGRGFKVFTEVARCSLCHAPPLFSDLDFHNTGVGFAGGNPDLGRGKHLAAAAAKAGQPVPPEAEALQGAFKTPTLRGVALSPPYFHDASAATLEEAVDYMLSGGTANDHLDEKLQPRDLTPEQRQELLAFLRALTPDASGYQRPDLP